MLRQQISGGCRVHSTTEYLRERVIVLSGAKNLDTVTMQVAGWPLSSFTRVFCPRMSFRGCLSEGICPKGHLFQTFSSLFF